MTKMTEPRCVIRMGSLTEELYLDRDGHWGEYKNAKRFRTQNAAVQFAAKHSVGDNYGLFDCSTPRRIRA